VILGKGVQVPKERGGAMIEFAVAKRGKRVGRMARDIMVDDGYEMCRILSKVL
jgi:hypothetical protein